MRHPRPEDVDAFGNRPRPDEPSEPRPIRAELEEVPSEHLARFALDLAEAAERFHAYQSGEASLEMMASAPEQREFFLAQDQVNTWLRGRIVNELMRRGYVIRIKL